MKFNVETVKPAGFTASVVAQSTLNGLAGRSRLLAMAGWLAIPLLVFLVYSPILPGNFLLDDWRLIDIENGLVKGEFTPFNIWFQTDFTLSSLVLWLQRLAFGHTPGGYHFVNLLLHAASAVLVWRLLAKLKIPGAWLAGALFAVHPVAVNSVARIAEIKNTLSLPFFLLGLLAYLHYETLALYPDTENPDANPRARWQATAWYVLALTAFIAALLAKTSTVMLPVILIACAAWQRGRLTRKDWWHTTPFFVLALAFGLMSVWFQKHQAIVSAGVTIPPASFWMHLAIAGQVFGFYLGKALLPLNLNLFYPPWKPGGVPWLACVPYLVAVGGLIWCWRFPFSRARHAVFALGCFAIALFPVMGVFDSQFLATWLVSDHLQYLPLIAPVALVAAVLAGWRNETRVRWAAAGLLAVLAMLTFQRATVFSSEEKLLRDTLAKNPAASVAHNYLGVLQAKKQDYAGARQSFESAVRTDPANAQAHGNLGHLLTLDGRVADAEKEFQAALRLKPYDPETHKNYARLLQATGRHREAIFNYQVALRFFPELQTRSDLASLAYATGRTRLAAAEYRRILEADPNHLEALNNLAWLLATCGDETVRNGVEAVRCAEKACALTDYKQARMTGTLAAAYAEAKRFPEAVATGQTTLKLADAAGEKSLTDVGNQLLLLYRDGKAYHEAPPAAVEF